MGQAREQEQRASSSWVHWEDLGGARKPQQGGLRGQEKSSGSLKATSELQGGEGTRSARCPWQAARRSVRVGTREQTTFLLCELVTHTVAEDPHKTSSALSGHTPLKQLTVPKASLFLLTQGVSTCWSPFPKGGCCSTIALSPSPLKSHPLPPCFPCASCLSATPSPCFRGCPHSTVTLPLSVPSQLNAGWGGNGS